ncbi:MAG: stage III sporulation AC/AD family protein [bacterium]|nr:stage III sporulation AC/AD family protein [bacterium]
MELLRVAAIGLTGVLIALQFKSQKSEYGLYIGIATGMILLCGSMDEMQSIISLLSGFDTPMIAGTLGRTLMKIVLLTYIAEFAAGICRDAGYQSISGQIEVFGKLSILILSLPALRTLLSSLYSFL